MCVCVCVCVCLCVCVCVRACVRACVCTCNGTVDMYRDIHLTIADTLPTADVRISDFSEFRLFRAEYVMESFNKTEIRKNLKCPQIDSKSSRNPCVGQTHYPVVQIHTVSPFVCDLACHEGNSAGYCSICNIPHTNGV